MHSGPMVDQETEVRLSPSKCRRVAAYQPRSSIGRCQKRRKRPRAPRCGTHAFRPRHLTLESYKDPTIVRVFIIFRLTRFISQVFSSILTVMARTILITGANRGIGFYILKLLAERKLDDQFILAARSLDKATAAIAELRSLGVAGNVDGLVLDVTSDESIKAAEQTVRERYGKLDVLINNAAIAMIPKDGEIDQLRSIYNAIYDTNVSAIAVMTTVFIPLLSLSPDPRVINVSSVVGSIAYAMSHADSATLSIPYNISKTALNIMMFEFQKVYRNVLFQATNPGYCKTGLNNYMGTRDPQDGAAVVVELTNAERSKYKSGFWEMANGVKECTTVEW